MGRVKKGRTMLFLVRIIVAIKSIGHKIFGKRKSTAEIMQDEDLTKEKRWEKIKYTDNARVFDNRQNYWGHRVKLGERTAPGKPYYNCDGHLSPLPKEGDVTIIRFERGPVACMFVEVRPCESVDDMFFGIVATLDHVENIPQFKKYAKKSD